MKIDLCLTILLFVYVPSALAADVEDYKHFLKNGIWDTKLSNEEANNIVKIGFQHSDPKIANLTLRALGELSIQVAWSRPGRDGGAPPMRTFSDVTGLKQFLIDLWYSKFKESGYDTVSVLKEASSLREGESIEDQARRILGRERHSEITLQDVADATLASIPAWTYAPTILSVYWPKDQSVYALIWHAQDNESSSRPNIMTLLCLNAGKFNSDKDDEFRFSLIDSHSDDYSLNLTISIYASHGLRFSKPDTALNLLVDFATNNFGPRDTILVLTAEYQDEHLLPHIQNLTRIYKNFNLNYVPKQILEAHNRIFSLTAK